MANKIPSVPGQAHAGSADFAAILRKIAPFFFKKKKQVKTSALPVKEVKVVKTRNPKKPKNPRSPKIAKHKTHARSASKKVRTAKMPAATLEVRKHMKSVEEKTTTASAKADIAGKKSDQGFVIAPEERHEDAAEMHAEILSEGDEFLQKVKMDNAGGTFKASKPNGMSILMSRWFTRAPAIKKDAAPALSSKDIASDGFLQRVQKKSASSVIGTAVDEDKIREEVIQREAAESLEDFASGGKDKSQDEERMKRVSKKDEGKGKILSAADLRKESKMSKDAAERLAKDVKEIKEEMREQQKTREKEIEQIDKTQKAEAEKETPKAHVKVKMRRTNGLQSFLSALGHFGMGKERIRFVQNMSMMLNAGLPLIDSLKTLQMETRSKPMRKLLQKILDAVENGSPLWRAMENENFFTLHALALIRIGEEAGNLAENMVYLAEQEEKDHALKSKVTMAMIYPTIVMTIMFIIVVGLGMFVLPKLIGVLFSLNVELPLVTRLVIMFSNAFTTYGAVGVPSFIGGFIFIIILAKYTPVRRPVQWIMFHIPGIGRLAQEATIARFGVILGGLLRAGVPVVEAMQSLVEVTPIASYRRLYSKILDHITVGDSFSKSFASIRNSHKLLPPSVQQLVITGEKSGSLSDIMLKIADIYDKKASSTAEKLPVILEPMLLLFIGGLVGTIAFAIIIPIYSIVGNVTR
jgi:type IV pilus assembly protein PilC